MYKTKLRRIRDKMIILFTVITICITKQHWMIPRDLDKRLVCREKEIFLTTHLGLLTL